MTETLDVGTYAFPGNALRIAGEVESALSLYDDAVDEARARGGLYAYEFALTHRAHAHYGCGELAEGEADARGALEASARESVMRPLGVFALVETLTARGELDAADEVFEGYDFSEGAMQSVVFNWTLEARGRLRLAQGRPREALADLRMAGERHLTSGLVNPAYAPWRSGAALALAALGEREEAQALAYEELELARSFGAAPALGIALRCAGVVTGDEGGLALLGEAVAVLERSPARLEHARALVELGAALRRANRRSQARDPLGAGMDLAHHCGAIPLARYARDELASTGARPRRLVLTGVDSLTASELRVARMAAAGLTNREIAQALFVTVKTVQKHLGNTYAKLDVGSREDLAATLGDRAR
jgi:DNA-binding CsgD family transcriptional regulator